MSTLSSSHPSHPTRHSARRMTLLLFALFAVLSIVILACGESSTNSGANAGTNSGPTATSSGSSASGNHFKVGDQVKVGDTYIVTVNSFKTNPGDAISQPKAGNTFAVADVTIKNISSQEQNLSSLLQFTLKDATGQKYTETIVSGVTPPDGKLTAGDTIKGQMAYEVPTAQHDFTLAFEADVMSSGQTIWDLQL